MKIGIPVWFGIRLSAPTAPAVGPLKGTHNGAVGDQVSPSTPYTLGTRVIFDLCQPYLKCFKRF